MKSWPLVVLVPLVLGGCGPRTEVLKDKVVAQVDKLLGELDVKKKEVELNIKAMDQARDEMQKGKIKLEVKAEQLGEQIKGLEERVAATDKSLRQLRDFLASEADVEIAGKKYTKPQVQEMANKVIDARKSLDKQLESLKRSQQMLQQRVEKLDGMLAEHTRRLDVLKTKMAEIDTNVVALKAMRDTSGVGGTTSTADSFAQLEAQVSDLNASLEAELRFEQLKWDQAAADQDVTSAEEIIRATQGTGDTLQEIDKLLGAGEKQ